MWLPKMVEEKLEDLGVLEQHDDGGPTGHDDDVDRFWTSCE